MINIESKITENQIWIKFKGHTQPEVCSAVSSVMYTTINAIYKYNSECLNFFDDNENDEIEILIHKPDDIIKLLVNNMFDMFKDVIDDGNEDKINLRIE